MSAAGESGQKEPQPAQRVWGEGPLKSRVLLLKRRSREELLYFLILGAILAASVIIPVFEKAPMDLCGFHRLTGLPCPGCGSTRAFVHMGHGMISAALAYNPSAVVLYLLLLGRWLLSIPSVVARIKLRLFSTRAVILILVGYLTVHVIHGIVRLILVAKGQMDWPPLP